MQRCVVRGQVTLPRAVTLFQTQQIQREHAERLDPVFLSRLPHRVEDRGRIGHLGVDFPAEFAGKRYPHQLAIAPGNLRRLMRQPGFFEIGIADIAEQIARLRPGHDLARRSLRSHC